MSKLSDVNIIYELICNDCTFKDSLRSKNKASAIVEFCDSQWVYDKVWRCNPCNRRKEFIKKHGFYKGDYIKDKSSDKKYLFESITYRMGEVSISITWSFMGTPNYEGISLSDFYKSYDLIK